MLFGDTVAVYCENHTEHTDTLCARVFNVYGGGTYTSSYRYQSSDYIWGAQTPLRVRSPQRVLTAT
jgi:hypothetical protein